MEQETLKKIVELADGFEWRDKEGEDYEVMLPENNTFLCSWCNHFKTDRWKQIYYPSLLRRAVEGWNKSNPTICYFIDLNKEYLEYGNNCYPNHPLLWYKNYQKTEYLTPQEQAIEACLIELLEDN